MEAFLGVLLFVLLLAATMAAVVAIQAERGNGRSPAYDAIRRDRGARVIWDSAN
jgi:hypothetical protein